LPFAIFTTNPFPIAFSNLNKMVITSFSNPRIKAIRKLEQKKYRQESGLFFVEGLRTVGEAIQTNAQIESLVIAPDLLISDFGLSILDNPGLADVERLEISVEIFEKIAQKQGPQGIGAVVHQNWQPLSEIIVGSEDIWVALESVADPGNLGTIMRTADGIGARGIILLGQSTDPYDPAAVKASMGAIFSLVIAQADWKIFHAWQRNQNLTLTGTSDRAETDYKAVHYTRPLVLLMGSERHGLPDEMLEACDHVVSIPMQGRSDSLNLAVATGIMLYEIYDQTRNLDIIES